MIKPVNGHLLIEPIKHESFMASQHETYQEIGVVLDVAKISMGNTSEVPKVGDKVFFDSWLAAKFPKGTDGEYYWLVEWQNVRAVEEKKNAE